MTDLSSFTPSYLQLTTHQPPQGGPSLLEKLKNVRGARERHRRPHDVKYLGSLSDGTPQAWPGVLWIKGHSQDAWA